MKVKKLIPTVVFILAILLPHLGFASERTKPYNKYKHFRPPAADGFLQQIRRPFRLNEPRDQVYERICEAAERNLPLLSCPPIFTDRVTRRNFLPPPVIAADLPHMRIAIFIDRVEHQAITGGGIGQDPDAQFDDFWLFWDVESDVAVENFPGKFTGLPVNLNPGEVWNPGVSQPIFSGFVENGCSLDTVVEVKLTSQVHRELVGAISEVQLVDTIVSTGNFIVSYSQNASEGTDAVSRFIFGGTAKAYCVATL